MPHLSSGLAVLAAVFPLLSACDPVTGTVVGGAAAVGVGAAQERGLEGAIDDTKIRAEINNLWFQQDVQMFTDVDLSVTEGRVLLTGAVKKPENRVEAVRLAWQAAGVRQVIDEIQVTDQSGIVDYGRDVRITETLRFQLMFDKNIKNINFNFDVVNAVVYLSGIAQDEAERERVIAYARDIGGVKKVISYIILKNDPKRQAG